MDVLRRWVAPAVVAAAMAAMLAACSPAADEASSVVAHPPADVTTPVVEAPWEQIGDRHAGPVNERARRVGRTAAGAAADPTEDEVQPPEPEDAGDPVDP